MQGRTDIVKSGYFRDGYPCLGQLRGYSDGTQNGAAVDMGTHGSYGVLSIGRMVGKIWEQYPIRV